MTAETISPDDEQTWNTPAVILPHPSVFLDQSLRFTALAEGHSLGDWLHLLGILTGIQHELLQEYPQPLLPDDESMAFAGENRLPPISSQSWLRDPSWRQLLKAVAQKLAPHAPLPLQNTLNRLHALESAEIEVLAEKVLKAELHGRHTDLLPFVAAALQVYWTALATGLDVSKLTPLDMSGLCPCCGFLPVSSIVRSGGEVDRLRYLHCALCNTEWNFVRVTCTVCHDSGRMAYHHIEGSDGSIRAETCDACKSYLKILYQDKSSLPDPVADDLSTLSLDILIDQAGYNRKGPNLLFVPG